MPATGSDEPTVPPSQAPTASTLPSATAPRALPAHLAAGAVISRYRIESVLGEGGMGVVYLARQEKPDREVALKVVRPGYATERMLRRFEHETEVLGRLLHPGIAQIYEAGVWTSPEREREGLPPTPFFAMELVKGVSLTRSAAEKKLSTRERLELLAKVCDAVQHAHQKGVIHRDLKPGNILVTEEGQPKILDFGVARATDSDIQQTTMQTDVGAIVGTIPYMSPEQVGGNTDELDTRSDVYALGVIAYELLAGRLPYDLERKMIHEAARIIREDEPTRLSSIDRTLRGDVETIVGHALEKDRARRYSAASALAADIRRYLGNEPIAARPASTWYQLQKFSSRNRALVTGVAMTLLMLVAGIVATGLALQREAEQRAEAVKQQGIATANADEARNQQSLAEVNAIKEAKARRRAEDINAFVTKSLQSGDPMGMGSKDATIVEAMGNAIKELESGAFKHDPETEADMRDTIGTILLNNGRYAEARSLYEKALAARERLFSGEDRAVATSLLNLAELLRLQGQHDQAEKLLTRALAIFEKTLGAEHPEVARSLNNLGVLYEDQGKYAKAEPLHARALAIREKALGPEHSLVASSINSLAAVCLAQEQYTRAEPLFARAVAIWEVTLGPEHPFLANGLSNMAVLQKRQGHYAQAQPLYERALSIRERALGPDHPLVATSLNNLALLHNDQGRYAEAEPLFARALAIDEKALGSNHPDLAVDLHNLAECFRAQSKYTQAEPLFARAVMIWEVSRPDHPNVVGSLNGLARTRQALGMTAQARQDFDQAIAILRRRSPDGSATLARVLWRSASARLENNDAAAALPEIEEAVAMAERFLPPEHAQLREYRETLAGCKAALAR